MRLVDNGSGTGIVDISDLICFDIEILGSYTIYDVYLYSYQLNWFSIFNLERQCISWIVDL